QWRLDELGDAGAAATLPFRGAGCRNAHLAGACRQSRGHQWRLLCRSLTAAAEPAGTGHPSRATALARERTAMRRVSTELGRRNGLSPWTCAMGPCRMPRGCRIKPRREVKGRVAHEKGRGRGAGAFLARVRSGCGAGARRLAEVNAAAQATDLRT